jgi:hypothetical protein
VSRKRLDAGRDAVKVLGFPPLAESRRSFHAWAFKVSSCFPSNN